MSGFNGEFNGGYDVGVNGEFNVFKGTSQSQNDLHTPRQSDGASLDRLTTSDMSTSPEWIILAQSKIGRESGFSLHIASSVDADEDTECFNTISPG